MALNDDLEARGPADGEARSTADSEALLAAGAASAGEEGTEKDFPLEGLPALPTRNPDFYMEPWCGVFLVCGISAVLVCFTAQAQTSPPPPPDPGGPSEQAASMRHLASLALRAVMVWAAVALCSMLYLLFGRNGEIKRSSETCYPIPPEVVQRLSEAKSAGSMRNVRGQGGRTYCVRCLIWRPGPREGGPGHHCSTCQRCVTGFDHHCGVFGRCITAYNLPCFYLLPLMGLAGLLTAFGAHSMLT